MLNGLPRPSFSLPSPDRAAAMGASSMNVDAGIGLDPE